MKLVQLNQMTLVILALSLSLLGGSTLLMGHHHHIQIITDFYGVSDLLSGEIYNNMAAISLIFSGVLALMTLKQSKHKVILGKVLMVVSLIPLFALFAKTMWIDSLGGFPAIGTGQGIIKYFALLSIGILFAFSQLSPTAKKWLSLFPVLLVLAWIGGMKFTLIEAKGIEALVASSPLMSWMYDVWDLQTTSNIIGIYDLIAILVLILATFNIKFMKLALLMAGAVFLVTQSFLLTWDGALSSETMLSTGGHFLIKDLWFVINLIMFWQISCHKHGEPS